MQALGQISSFKGLAFNPKTIVAIGALLTGVAVVQAPIIPWILLGALSGLLLLECPVYVWVAGTKTSLHGATSSYKKFSFVEFVECDSRDLLAPYIRALHGPPV